MNSPSFEMSFENRPMLGRSIITGSPTTARLFWPVEAKTLSYGGCKRASSQRAHGDNAYRFQDSKDARILIAPSKVLDNELAVATGDDAVVWPVKPRRARGKMNKCSTSRARQGIGRMHGLRQFSLRQHFKSW